MTARRITVGGMDQPSDTLIVADERDLIVTVVEGVYAPAPFRGTVQWIEIVPPEGAPRKRRKK